MKDDPTLHTARTCVHQPYLCDECGHGIARFTQAPLRESSTSIELVMFCLKRDNKRVLCKANLCPECTN